MGKDVTGAILTGIVSALDDSRLNSQIELYGAHTITTLDEDREQVREKPHMFIPDRKKAGRVHLVKEILDNSIDELMIKNSVGHELDMYFNEKDEIVRIEDNGRGMPIEKVYDACEKLYTSGKHAKGGDNPYREAGGMNGVGLKIVNFLSEYLKVVSARAGRRITAFYVDSYRVEEKSGESKTKGHGTIVEFQPSDKYLGGKLKYEDILNIIEEKAYILPELYITFKCDKKDGKSVKHEYHGKNISQIVAKNHKVTTEIQYMKEEIETVAYDGKPDLVTVEMAFGYDPKEMDSFNIIGFTNYIKNDKGGTHCDGLKDGICEFFKDYVNNTYLSHKERKVLKIRSEDCRIGLEGAVTILMSKAELKGQFKEELMSDNVSYICKKAMVKFLKTLPKNKLKEYCDVFVMNARARMKSKNAKESVKKIGQLGGHKIQKYFPVSSRSTMKFKELFLLEGDSAGGSVNPARNKNFQATYLITGNPTNANDLSDAEVYKIPLYRDLIDIIGAGWGESFDISKANFDRINIFTDADVDGAHISATLFSFFVKFMPGLIVDGRLFKIIPPLYAFDYKGKKKFVSTRRTYLQYLQRKFTNEYDLFFDGKKMSDEVLNRFLIRNETYYELMSRAAKKNAVSVKLIEKVLASLRIGYGKEKVQDWKNAVSDDFEFISVEYVNKTVTLSGTSNGNYDLLYIDDKLVKSCKKILAVIDSNIGNVYGYGINKGQDDMSIYDVMKEFKKYEPKSLTRFKGLGEMDPEDIQLTCMDLKHRHSIKLKFDNKEYDIERINVMHSGKKRYKDAKKVIIQNFVPDIMDIDT
jgi:DNA gyrase/topoisomerase IV subunit B